MASEEWIYRFGDVEVEPAAHRIARGGNALNVEPKAFAVLVALLEQHGRALERDALLDRVWGHRHVTPGVLNRVVAQLRKALGDHAEHPRYIQTLHSLGYRFIGQVERVPATADDAAMAVAGADAAPIPPSEPQAANDVPASAPAPTRLRHFALASLLALAALALGLFWQRQQAPRPEASIAVLPFASLSDRPEDSYFAEGLAVEMHDTLAGVEGLTVAARMTPGDAQRRETDVKALGRRLGVATVLDASVRRQGSRLRISARLADTRTGYTLWSHTYDRKLSDVFATQSEIADEVVRSLLGAMAGRREALARRLTPTRNVAAFDAYLRGLQQLLHRNGGSEEKAIGYFNQALSRDSGFARAQAGICTSEVFRFEHERVAEAFDTAKRACARARELDPGLGEVSLALAKLHHAQDDLGAASEYYAKTQADPAHRPAAFVGLALLQGEQGRHARAIEYLDRAIAASPGNADVYAYRGYYHYLTGDLGQSIASYRRAVALQPGNQDYWSTLGAVYVSAGDNAAATRALEKSIALKPNYAALSNLGELRYQAGDYADAARLYREAIELEPADYIPWGNLANALLAEAATAGEARAAFMQAAARARQYLAIKSNDATALAALGWFQANLGARDRARELVARSESLRGDPMEVALFNAQTLAVLGDFEQARRRVAAARAAGLPETRIATNVVLRRAGLAAAAPAGKPAGPSAPNDG